MLIKIKSWDTGKVLHSIETDSLKVAVEALIKQGADFSWANFSGADLSGADLYGAQIDDLGQLIKE